MRYIITILTTILLLYSIAMPCYAGVDLDGTDGYIDLSSVLPSGAMTISAWIKIGAVSAQSEIISSGDTNGAQSQEFRLTDTGTIQYGELDGGGWTSHVSTAEVDDGAKHHVGITKSAGDVVVLYIDGGVDGGGSNTKNPANLDNTNIGSLTFNNEATKKFFGGVETEITVWDTALTAAEMLLIASAKMKRIALQIQPSNLVGHWSLDDVAEGETINAATFLDMVGAYNGTGSDAGNQSVGIAETFLSYP